MSKLIALILVLSISACGTIGGTVSGAGKDLQQLGGWISSK